MIKLRDYLALGLVISEFDELSEINNRKSPELPTPSQLVGISKMGTHIKLAKRVEIVDGNVIEYMAKSYHKEEIGAK